MNLLHHTSLLYISSYLLRIHACSAHACAMQVQDFACLQETMNQIWDGTKFSWPLRETWIYIIYWVFYIIPQAEVGFQQACM